MPKIGERTTFGEILPGGYAVFKPDEGTCEKPFLVYVRIHPEGATALMTHFDFKKGKPLPLWDELKTRTPYHFHESMPVSIEGFIKPPKIRSNIYRLNRRFRK